MPSVKVGFIGFGEVGEIIRTSGADFVEGAILGAVGATGAGTHILVGGERGREVADFMTRNPFDRVAPNWVRTHAVAYERRYHEMVQVAETMRELGVEPVMTSGTEAFFRRSLSLGLKDGFPEKPSSMGAVIDFMEKRLREKR